MIAVAIITVRSVAEPISNQTSLPAAIDHICGTEAQKKYFDENATSKSLLDLAQTLENAVRVKKDEFETTEEFLARYRTRFEATTTDLPRYFIFTSTAEGTYDADNGYLSVWLPKLLFSIGEFEVPQTVVVRALGDGFPESFLFREKRHKPTPAPPSTDSLQSFQQAGRRSNHLVRLQLGRDEARVVKGSLKWAFIAQAPSADLIGDPREHSPVSRSHLVTAISMRPIAALLFVEGKERVLYQTAFMVPPSLRLRGSNAVLGDWLDADTEAQRQAAAHVLGDPTPDVGQLASALRQAIDLQQLSSDEPISSLKRLADLPTPTLPIPRRQVAPIYPRAMARSGIVGHVLVAFVVKQDGSVKDVEIVRSSRAEFEAAAIECVSQWKFRPATLSGKKIEMKMQVPIAFSLYD